MKANVPEKIYINDFGSELSYDWHTENCCENDIEYVRKDAFVEKARKWFEEQTGFVDLEGNRHWDEEEFEDFKKAMTI